LLIEGRGFGPVGGPACELFDIVGLKGYAGGGLSFWWVFGVLVFV
jgi:hypothetical protein